MEGVARWVSETLLTITSNVFTELTIYFPPDRTVSENELSGWNSVDKVLDRLSLCEDVTLVVTTIQWEGGDSFNGLIRVCFPSMWGNGKVMLKMPPFDGGRIRGDSWGIC